MTPCKIQGIFPVYGERDELYDTAYGIVIVINDVANALAYDGGWKIVEKRGVDGPADGVGFDQYHIVEELHEEIFDQV